MTVLGGYDLDKDGRIINRPILKITPGQDYGCDPVGKNEAGVFMFRMVPSGDIVDGEEKEARLRSLKKDQPK